MGKVHWFVSEPRELTVADWSLIHSVGWRDYQLESLRKLQTGNNQPVSRWEFFGDRNRLGMLNEDSFNDRLRRRGLPYRLRHDPARGGPGFDQWSFLICVVPEDTPDRRTQFWKQRQRPSD